MAEISLDELSEQFHKQVERASEMEIKDLEYAIENFELPEANGFFWGSDSYFWNDENDEPFPENEYWYKSNDLEFVKQARKMLDNKHRIYYSCWY